MVGQVTKGLPFSDEPPACVQQEDTWCAYVFNLTNNEWLAASADWLVARPLRVLLILAVALTARYLARRAIDRLTRVSGERTPAVLRPLKERAPQMLGSLVSERRAQRARTLGSVLNSVVSFAVFSLAGILILGELGLNLGPIVASAGIVGIALGFGAQNLVKDFLSGLFMMFEDQYGVGDVVDLGEASGTVESVGLRVTTIRDMSGTVWYVRNGEVLRVGNSSQGFAVAVIDVPLGYGADVDQATAALARVATEVTSAEDVSKDVLEPPEVLGVEKVSPEGITLRLTVKVRPGRQWAVQRILRAKAMAAFENAGIKPPMGRLFPGPEAPERHARG
jgi:moderate conductance mechanosensitive channel